MSTVETLVLTAADVRDLLPLDDCIAAVEYAFASHARGALPEPSVLGYRAGEGGFHLKVASLGSEGSYLAAKLNANFPANPERSGLPTIQGVLALFDTRDGRLLALMDSIEITSIRTGAATAVAARYLARPESSRLALFGCGRQAQAQVACLRRVLPLGTVFAFDRRAEAVDGFQRAMADIDGLEVRPAGAEEILAEARECDVIVTCTSSRRFILRRQDVGPGSFVAGVGADAEGKQELEPALLANATVVADLLDQCARIGDLHHAIDSGHMRREDVHAELGQVITGQRRGRRDAAEITIFDSTGTALQDVAAAALVYERAVAGGKGTPIVLGD